jgi:serine/threonine-protein kinase
MTREEDRAPLSTEISSPETEVDPQGLRRSDNGSRDPDPSKADPAPDERLAIGERLSGRYRIERELGEGGMGVVYLVSDEQVAGETFAVKVLKRCVEPEALRLLREEVRQTRKLSHPNIVDMHSVNVDGKRLYVLMEYLEGKTLNTLLDEEFGRGMPFSHAWPIIEDVGAALGYAHDHNVIHSDLKPANVLLTTSGKTKLLDFGIARVSRGPLLHERSGSRALTPAYASCEMLKGQEADRRDDIYSFACVIYEMLSGDRPFGELNALEARDVGTRVPPLAALSQAQNEALAQALAFDRGSRTPSVEQLLARLVTDKAPGGRRNAVLVPAVIATLAVLGFAYLALDKLWISRRSVVVQPVTSETQPANPRAATSTLTFNPSPRSIAVLPFADMSEKKDQEYFADGLAEELLDLLAKTPGLHVIARTSSFSFKGKSDDIPTIAAKLKVANILEGSVRKSGNHLRISTQLVRAADGEHLWSETYDRQLKDVFEVQDQIADAVVTLLKLKLSPGQESSPSRSSNTDAYLQYLLGQERLSRNSFSDFRAAVEAYRSAISLDPHYTVAYAGLALAEAFVADVTGDTAGLERASAAAERAIALAPNQSRGYAARGLLRAVWEWDWTGAQADFAKAIELDPNDPTIMQHYSGVLASFGRVPEAITLARRAADIDPLSVRIWWYLTFWLTYSGDISAARDACRHALAIDPANERALAQLGTVELLDRKPADALAVFEKIRGYDRLTGIAMAEHSLGRTKESRQALDEAIAKTAQAMAYQIAEAHAWRGETDKAFEWLERAYRQRDGGLAALKVDPLLASLRTDPRYKAMLKKINLPG